MPPRYVINSLTRQTIDTTVKFAPSISSPCATVEAAEGFASLAASTLTASKAMSVKKSIAAVSGVARLYVLPLA